MNGWVQQPIFETQKKFNAKKMITEQIVFDISASQNQDSKVSSSTSQTQDSHLQPTEEEAKELLSTLEGRKDLLKMGRKATRDNAINRRFIFQRQREQIAMRLAMFEPYDVIAEWASKTFNRKVTVRSISKYVSSPTVKALVKRFREEYDKRLFEVEYASKRRRIERLSKVADRLEEKEDYRGVTESMRAIREEVEGRKSEHVNIYQYNQFNSLSDEELENRKLEIIQRIQRLQSQKLLADSRNSNG
jgi:hypothetical protein